MKGWIPWIGEIGFVFWRNDHVTGDRHQMA
jgi:hypothetical protein